MLRILTFVAFLELRIGAPTKQVIEHTMFLPLRSSWVEINKCVFLISPS